MRRVLVVEDNPTNLALMAYLLRAYGYEVLTAEDGQRGVDAARQDPPDIILMDLQMPTMNGFEAARHLKAHKRLARIPLIAVTAFAMVGDRDKILAHGFDGYISKPIDPETFVDQVQAFIPAGLRAAAPAAAPADPAPTPAVASKQRTILVVDNSPVNLNLVKSTLEPFGYAVVTAASVVEALHLLQLRPPDLILSDVHMPGQSGYDLIRLVKANVRIQRVPFLFISSTVWGDRERETGLRLGARRFILRPIEPAALVAEIEACLKEPL